MRNSPTKGGTEERSNLLQENSVWKLCKNSTNLISFCQKLRAFIYLSNVSQQTTRCDFPGRRPSIMFERLWLHAFKSKRFQSHDWGWCQSTPTRELTSGRQFAAGFYLLKNTTTNQLDLPESLLRGSKLSTLVRFETWSNVVIKKFTTSDSWHFD